MSELFRKFASKISYIVGTPRAFIVAVVFIATWAITGPIFGFSNTWQLVINTFTTITTFLIVFLIQNTQNRDSKAIHIKLDELLKSIHGARNSLVDIEEVSDEELEGLHMHFQKLHERYAGELERRKQKAKT
jgi:low affinity Fe/Cu permease